MYVSQYFIDTVQANSKDLKKFIALDLFSIREPFERADGLNRKIGITLRYKQLYAVREIY